MYFALKGGNFDGNQFAKDALEKGARYCVVDDATVVKSKAFILVNDVLKTLQELANYHRHHVNIPIIALTGSNGKTTTKELIYTVLKSTYTVKATIGNLNNHIGVPLSLLRLKPEDDFGIIEMGANHQKEIEFLSRIAEPDYGLITNFGKAHLEGFGGVEGVIKGKSELYSYLKDHQKTVFINADDVLQVRQIGNYDKVVTFGSATNNTYSIQLINADPFVSVNYKTLNMDTQLIGHYNFGNIAVAIAIGAYFNVSPDHIKNAIESYNPDNNRSQIITKGTIRIILDAYNANPTSMMAALQNFNQLNATKKMVILGDMFELGKDAAKEHQAIVDYLEMHYKGDAIVCGSNFFNTKVSASHIKAFETFEDLKTYIQTLVLNDSQLLIKGSRGMALERVLEVI